jgi:MoxR-like ATPase
MLEVNPFLNTPDDTKKFLSSCYGLKPRELIINETKWKYLVRSVIKGKNTLIVGHTGTGKTKAAYSASKILNKEDKFFYFNCGSSQDARAMFIGNTFFKKDIGTILYESAFVKAIQIPGAVILLDELSRLSHDGMNLLFPVLDPMQRYIRLDESEDSKTIKVADGVTFIATANIGSEYTATKVLDKALLGRFSVMIEMAPLEFEEELHLLSLIYPESTEEEKEKYQIICNIAKQTREQIKKDDSKISSFIQTRAVIEMAEQINDGFSIEEIIDISIYPLYSEEGGVDSERTFMKMCVQKIIPPKNIKNPVTNS